MFFWHDNIFTKYSRHLMFVSIVPYHVDIYFISLLFIMSCSCSLTCSPPPRPSSTPCPPPRPSRASSSPWPRSSWGPAPPRSLCASELCRRRCVYFIGLYLKELNLWSNVVFETMHMLWLRWELKAQGVTLHCESPSVCQLQNTINVTQSFSLRSFSGPFQLSKSLLCRRRTDGTYNTSSQ